MIEINLLRKEGWRYNHQHSFVWPKGKVGESMTWFVLVVREGEPGAIFSRVAKVKGSATQVYN